ncbi:four helix bundle protein [Niabella aquatica]
MWHLAADLSNQIDLLTKSFPFEERYSLSSQIKRAADSVALNIAEGSTGQTIALRSAIEVVAALFLAKGRNYIYEEVKQNCITNTKCCVK